MLAPARRADDAEAVPVRRAHRAPAGRGQRVQYGPRHDQYEELLGNADYSLVAHGGHDLFTFCMCAGGYIIPSVSQEGYFCTNGMSLSRARFAVRQQRAGRDGAGGSVRRARTCSPGCGFRSSTNARRSSWAAASTARRSSGRRTSCVDAASTGRPDVQLPARRRRRATCARCCRRSSRKRSRTACRRWTAAGTARFLADAVLVGPGSARQLAGAHRPRRCEPRVARRSRGCTRSAKGRATRAASVSAAVDGLRTARAIVAKYALS